jgi:lipoprotein NlpI
VTLSDAWRFDEALAAFDRALAVSPTSAAALVASSVAALGRRQDDRADRAFRQALDVDAADVWYRNRAFAAFSLGREDVALADAQEYLRRVGWSQEGAPYVGLIAALAARRLGHPADADAILAEAERAVPQKTWTAEIVQYLRRRLTDAQLLGRAKDVGQRTEAHTYIGLACLQEGRVPLAIEHLTWVVTEGARNYSEYDLARRELVRLTVQGRVGPR